MILQTREIARLLAALALMASRQGGTLVVERMSEVKDCTGDLIAEYDKANDRLLIHHRLTPSPSKAKWN